MTEEDLSLLEHAVRAHGSEIIAASARLTQASDVAFLLVPTDEGFELRDAIDLMARRRRRRAHDDRIARGDGEGASHAPGAVESARHRNRRARQKDHRVRRGGDGASGHAGRAIRAIRAGRPCPKSLRRGGVKARRRIPLPCQGNLDYHGSASARAAQGYQMGT